MPVSAKQQLEFNQSFFSPEAIEQRLAKKFEIRNKADVAKEGALAPIKKQLFKDTQLAQTGMEIKGQEGLLDRKIAGEKDVAGIRNAPAMRELDFTTGSEAFNQKKELAKISTEPGLRAADTRSEELGLLKDELGFRKNVDRAEHSELYGDDDKLLKKRKSIAEIYGDNTAAAGSGTGTGAIATPSSSSGYKIREDPILGVMKSPGSMDILRRKFESQYGTGGR
jgi:hypothetical protein